MGIIRILKVGSVSETVEVSAQVPQREFLALEECAHRERSQLPFRWELFNALNRANFTLPVTSVNTITGAGRQMQFGLRYQF